METLIWIAITAGIGGLVWLAAPYHQRIIDDRPIVAPRRDKA